MIECGIYTITNTINAHKYVGSSNEMSKRLSNHKSLLNKNNHHNRHLQNAWNKYGSSAFVFAPVLQCSSYDLLFYEQLLLTRLCDLYNISRVAGTRLGVPVTKETKRKISATKTGRKMPNEQRLKMIGRKLTEQHKQAIAVGNKGRIVSEETKNKNCFISSRTRSYRTI